MLPTPNLDRAARGGAAAPRAIAMRRSVCRALRWRLSSACFSQVRRVPPGAGKAAVHAGNHNIAVPTFRNETLIPRIEVLVTDTMIRQIQQDGTYTGGELAADGGRGHGGGDHAGIAAAVPSVIGDVQATEEFEMTLVIHYKIIRKANGVVVDDRTSHRDDALSLSAGM